MTALPIKRSKLSVIIIEKKGGGIDTIFLRDKDFKFCLNCRECMQNPGPNPEPCVQIDTMKEIVEKLECADALVLASPTNLGSVTALFKRFMERLSVYAYWSWGSPAPKYRKDNIPKKEKKKALLVSSSAAPGILSRWFFSTIRQLKYTARIIGANPIGIINNGLIAMSSDKKLTEKDIKKIKKQADKIL
jgi:multimeric flavodoxin WrbA